MEGDAKQSEIRDTCSFACEIDLTDFLSRGAAGEVRLIQSEGTLRLRIESERGILEEITEKASEPGTKVHKYKFKH